MKEAEYTQTGDLFEINQVGPYLLQEPLGSGNYGKVRRAIHKRTRDEFAIKAVPNFGPNLDLPRNIDIRREMSIQQALCHENIIQLYDVIVANSHVYLVMEYASHGDFFRIISKHGRLTEHTAKHYFRQLANAVQYCHDNGVYHRDLKPENLLLSANRVLKLTDFGFSAMKDHGPPLLKTNCGSPHYCAPEVWNGTQEGYDGRKSDAFSAGVVLFVMLTGTQPFYDEDEERLLRKVNRCKVTYPEYLSAESKDVLRKLLVKDPIKRWSLDKVQRHPWLVSDLDNVTVAETTTIVRRAYGQTRTRPYNASVDESAYGMAARALMRVF